MFSRILPSILKVENGVARLKSHPAFMWGMFAVFLVLVFVGVFFFVDQVMAQTGGGGLSGQAQSAAQGASGNTPAAQGDKNDASGPNLLERIAIIIAGLLLYLAQGLGQLLLLLLDVVIDLMQYNGFASSSVVAAGWALVRDFVNMFFVVILIAIAILTMFGIAKFAWYQQVIRLGLFAIAINFSKTIVVLIIDASQVIMLTFANALKDIAGGNFIQLFGLTDILTLSRKTLEGVATESTEPLQAFDWLISSALALGMMIIVVATTVLLAVTLVYRTVMLWVLIVLSPIAFFGLGASQVSGGLAQAWSEWMKQFKCAVLIGPILVFFLWLTLAVAGAGNIAATEGFSIGTDADRNTSSIPLQILNLDRMISFIIGLGMIYAGFQAATSFCAGGIPGAKLTRGVGGKVAAFGAGLGVAGLRRGGRLGRRGLSRADEGVRSGARAGGRFAEGLIAPNRDAAAQKKIDQLRTQERQATGSKRERIRAKRSALESKVAARQERLTGGLSNLSQDQLASRQEGLALKQSKNMKLSEIEKREMQKMTAQRLSDPKERKKLEDNGLLEHSIQAAGGYDALKKAVAGDDKTSESLKDFAKSRPDLAFQKKDDKGNLVPDWEKIRGEVTDAEGAKALGVEALRSPEMKEILTTIKTEKGDQTMLQRFESGAAGNPRKDALAQGMAGKLLGKSKEYLENQPIEVIVDQLNVEGGEQVLAQNQDLAQHVMSSQAPAAQQLFNTNTNDADAKQRAQQRYTAAMQSLGVDPEGASVDEEKFSKALSSSPGILANIKPVSFTASPAMKKKMVSAAAKGLGAEEIKRNVAQIKQAPKSEASEQMRENMQTIFDEGAKAEYGEEVNNDMSLAGAYFDAQMESMDAGLETAEATATTPSEGYKVPRRAETAETPGDRRAALTIATKRTGEFAAKRDAARARVQQLTEEKKAIDEGRRAAGERQEARVARDLERQQKRLEEAQRDLDSVTEQVAGLQEEVDTDEAAENETA